MSLFAEVAFPLPLDQTFHYLVPAEAAGRAAPGVRVRAPLGRKLQAGFILGVSEDPPPGGYVLKELHEVLDAEPAFTPAAIAFARRLSARHRSPIGEFLMAMLPPSLEFRAATRVRLTEAGRTAAAAGRVLRGAEASIAGVLDERILSLTALKRRTGLKSLDAAVRRMSGKGLLEVMDVGRAPKRPRRTIPPGPPRPSQLILDFPGGPDGPSSRLGTISAALASGSFASFYLHGPAVERWPAYSRLIRETRELGRAVLILAPDIVRAASLQEMISGRLGFPVALVHGGSSLGLREREWRDLRSGRTPIAVGPRSVLFSPLDRPGLVVVDEETEESYFQAESPAYDARAGARLKAEEAGAVLIQAAASPSVEAYAQAAEAGALLVLPPADPPPEAILVDDGGERGLLGRPVVEALGRTLESGGRGMIFLNRRGYASFLFCPRCGWIPRCPDCGTLLAFSKRDSSLACRYCRTRTPAAPACPDCGSRVLEPRGAGVEAVEEDLKRRFPAARVAVFDRDRSGSGSAREEALAAFAAGRTDLLVGTAALARAATERVPLVVVLNPEALLGTADYRAAQRTYRTVRRMLDLAAPSGTGAALIQTAFPEHHSLRGAARGDYRLFFDEEIRLREAMDLPPFTALAEVLFWDGTPRTLAVRAREFLRRAGEFGRGISLLGPALAAGPAGRGGRGVQVVVRARESAVLDACLEKCLKPIPGRRSVVRSD